MRERGDGMVGNGASKEPRCNSGLPYESYGLHKTTYTSVKYHNLTTLFVVTANLDLANALGHCNSLGHSASERSSVWQGEPLSTFLVPDITQVAVLGTELQ